MSYTYLGSSTPKARKRHRCYLCGEAIEPGKTYVRHAAADCGKAHSWKQHPECEAMTAGWDEDDWEYFPAYSLERPKPSAAESSTPVGTAGGEAAG